MRYHLLYPGVEHGWRMFPSHYLGFCMSTHRSTKQGSSLSVRKIYFSQSHISEHIISFDEDPMRNPLETTVPTSSAHRISLQDHYRLASATISIVQSIRVFRDEHMYNIRSGINLRSSFLPPNDYSQPGPSQPPKTDIDHRNTSKY